jgi:transcriptional regulator with XRE-family HTH domain
MIDTGTRPFRELLRELRLAAGLSREELAERAGLSVKAIAALERASAPCQAPPPSASSRTP